MLLFPGFLAWPCIPACLPCLPACLPQLLPLFHPHCLQASTVGVVENVYKPGVKLGEIREQTVAAKAGLRRGDLVLSIGDLLVGPQPGMVNAVVDKIK